MRILIIDDEARIRHIYTMFFREEGFEAMAAENYITAISLLTREFFDLVLLDIKMPGIDVREMYRIIKEFDSRAKIIISSVFSIEDQKQYIQGASAYHDKAQGISALIAKVKEALNDGQQENNAYS